MDRISLVNKTLFKYPLVFIFIFISFFLFNCVGSYDFRITLGVYLTCVVFFLMNMLIMPLCVSNFFYGSSAGILQASSKTYYSKLHLLTPRMLKKIYISLHFFHFNVLYRFINSGIIKLFYRDSINTKLLRGNIQKEKILNYDIFFDCISKEMKILSRNDRMFLLLGGDFFSIETTFELS